MPCRLPNSFLGASKRYGDLTIPVTDVELDHAVNPHVELRVLGQAMVPIFEEHSARLDAGLRIAEWEGMDGWEKALVVAQRRMKNALENIQSEAQIEAARRHAGRGMRK